jgi:hypothetical protein
VKQTDGACDRYEGLLRSHAVITDACLFLPTTEEEKNFTAEIQADLLELRIGLQRQLDEEEYFGFVGMV